MTITEAAKKWKMRPPMVAYYCRENLIPGLQVMDRYGYIIPDDAVRPVPRKRGPKVKIFETSNDDMKEN